MCTVQGEAVRALRACIATNIRQYCTQVNVQYYYRCIQICNFCLSVVFFVFVCPIITFENFLDSNL